MNSKQVKFPTPLAGFSFSLLSMAISSTVLAQADANTSLIAPPVMEETQVVGRLQTGAESLINERIEQAVATDYIGAEQIGRIGDSTVALALTRVPGITLVDGQYVFVRGLGERYSSTTLNGAMVPSPDLSRNVLPLDIIPTSIVESLAIQKVPSADQPAAFGGGSVNIRTRGIPEDFVFSIELGTGFHTESTEFITYDGGSRDRLGEDDGTRALSPDIAAALDSYRGDLAPSNIRAIGNLDSIAEARAINRQLATELNRDISVYETSGEPDIDAEVNLGNIFYLPNDMQFGFLAGVSYESAWRNYDIVQRRFTDPEQQVTFEDETVYSVGLSGNLSLGLHLNDENLVETTSLFLRNTDDEVSVRDYFNSNRLLSGGRGFRNTELRYEQRELVVHQIHGEHELGWQTLETLGLERRLSFLEGLKFDWYYSDSEASTDLPNEVNALSNIESDPTTGEALSSSLSGSNSSAVTYRFSELRDNLDSNGWELTMPFNLDALRFSVSGGGDYWQKARTYEQLEFYIGSTSISNTNPVLQGPLGDVLSDENILNPEYGFLMGNSRENANSYIAANKVDAYFASIDVTWDETLRAVVGSRWEDYQQVNLPWDPINYESSQFPGSESNNPEDVVAYFRNATYVNDDWYHSAALTWMLPGFWAEDFQLRLSYGETTVRPDLREISDSTYRDPITDISVDGNPNVVPSQIDNYDLRAEWFFLDGDNLTVSLFYKDILNPIELFEGAAADDNIMAEVHNAESAEVAGVEVEFLKRLGNLSDALDPFFVQGNLALLDHELVAGSRADAPTNPVRPLHGASDYVANLIFGFDSYDGMHAATLSYNVFSERLFFAGRNGAPDSYEQPFHSLDLTYSYYPTDQLTVKFKAKNLLDQDVVIERTNRFADGSAEDVEIYSKERGQDISLSVKYSFF
jgi:outer membrane receptor protein involved in Fe transport